MEHIRNFGIIAHIDHGKSTLADRLIQACGAVEDRKFRDQILDSMDLERERGITIKSNTVTREYKAADGKTYQLNLIDTPGHVDFSHEVRRSLMSCEGALLLVDASQGVEAQTVANLYLAMEYDLELVPVINKIDLPAADIDRVSEEIDADLGLDPFEAIQCSAKNNVGVDDVLEAIVTKLPPPTGDPEAPLKALVFDAQYDAYRGVVMLVRVLDGSIKKGQAIRLMHTEADHVVEEVGYLKLEKVKTGSLETGGVGYVIAGIKTIQDINIGDTITLADDPADVSSEADRLRATLNKIINHDLSHDAAITPLLQTLALSHATSETLWQLAELQHLRELGIEPLLVGWCCAELRSET